jgi:dihydroorotate dehydrogenase
MSGEQRSSGETVLDRMYALARPILHRLDAEQAHRVTVRALQLGLVRGAAAIDDPILATQVFGLDFANPVGLAAGFDKHAEVADAMLSLGFGFVEAGTVTPRPQPGNPKPRLFRLTEDRAVINRFGFNSGGLPPFKERLLRRRTAPRAAGIVGANVGKNRDTTDAAADYERCIEELAASADYLVVNVSSPNTPGLRSLQKRDEIKALLDRAVAAQGRGAGNAKLPPLLAKVGPDLDDEEVGDIAEAALASGLDGLIVGNTTLERPAGLKSPHKQEAGGLSGRPLKARANACLASMYRHTGGRLPLIGCGGIESGDDAYAKIRAGASLVQLYSALVFEGPGLVVRIKRDLAAGLRADGFTSLRDAVGADHR